jgi:ribosomal 50S subunit-recycling heat shock protein
MNHKIDSHTLNILAVRTGSKGRIRVPVAGVKNTKVIKPGDKVRAQYNEKGDLIITKVNHPRKCKKAFGKRNYTHTVEKNGAIRLNASFWGLEKENQIIGCDSLNGVIAFS